LVVERERLLDAARHLRDVAGFNFLADVVATDYLGWGDAAVAGYWASPPPDSGRGWQPRARDINAPFPGSQGLEKLPEPKRKRFSVSYHLLALGPEARRVRLQVWADEGEAVASVVELWPGADWFEREIWDLMGVPIEGHPNLARIIMDDDWEGHPLRKDYPLGGEPVRFSEAE
ncbi:MAG: NADH-quinone oxidoreductase subunit C, partial [Thermoleophilia bacterium]|nr:NADH-quinone oxidoreductase subunit C [Thermoleophilia bacterium]